MGLTVMFIYLLNCLYL